MIKFTLIENSLDSIEQGLGFFEKAKKDNCNSAYKHALLCLFQGAELILKEVLVIIDPIIIFDKNSLFRICQIPLAPTINELYKCKSIDIAELGRELRKNYPKIFNDGDIKILNKLALERNKIQHFAIEISPDELIRVLLEMYLRIIKPAFRIIQESDHKNRADLIDIAEINDRIMRFEESFLAVKVGDGFCTGSCPQCNEQHHLIIYENDSYPIYSYCVSCHYELKDIKSSSYEVCPECGANSLIYDSSKKAGVCLWKECYHCREGDFVEMKPCETCTGYRIENECKNCSVDEA